MKKQSMVYQWGSRKYPVDAQIVGDAVDRITAAEGYCEPRRLVAEAEPDDSPLHPLFTWDDDEAADKWRTHEARKVIGGLTVTVQYENQEVSAPAFISVGHVIATQDAGEGYRPLSVVVSDEKFAKEALAEATMRLRAIQRRYTALDALAPVWEALDLVAAD